MINSRYVYKIASNENEYDQIHRLNYETFAEEVKQHPANNDKKLIDPYNSENTYVICKFEDEVIGMLALRTNRPFSLDKKIDGLEHYLPPYYKVCEVRLLSIKKSHRNKKIIFGLFNIVSEYSQKEDIDLLIISGVLNQQKLYKHLGFIPFANVVGSKEALFQPMYLRLNNAPKKIMNVFKYQDKKFNFLPGPVEIKTQVKDAFNAWPVSHRSKECMNCIKNIKNSLITLTNSKYCNLLLGSGTLANDCIAQQLRFSGKGVIISNGEFGERLVDHAQRSNLEFHHINLSWGEKIEDSILSEISLNKPNWLWITNCETSTGQVNDIKKISYFCKSNSIKLCLDCISSIGSIPLDLSDVWIASASSGKALGSYPGLAITLHQDSSFMFNHSIPRYLDLSYYYKNEGMPFTQSSNLLYALERSLEITNFKEKINQIKISGELLKNSLSNCFLFGEIAEYSPAVTTLELPKEIPSVGFGSYLKDQGFFVSYESNYLIKRNFIQICLMGEFSQDSIDKLISCVKSGFVRFTDSKQKKEVALR